VAATIQIIPFRARHVLDIKPDAGPRMLWMAQSAEQSGPAWTAMLYGQAIGAGGVSIQRPGIGEAWTLFSPRIKRYPLFMHRFCKQFTDDAIKTLDEIYTVCSGDDRWLRALCFTDVSHEAMKYPEVLRKVKRGESLLVRRRHGMARGTI